MTQFIMLVIFALALNLLGFKSMLLLIVGFLLIITHQKNNHFLKLMKRFKWFYLIMFIIFLFNTPGEHIVNLSYGFKPTFEGLQLGVEQLLRITLMLAALSLILTKNTVQQLISGVYFLLCPLAMVGFDVKRFAARLWLTLHYVEIQQAESEKQDKSLIKGLGERLNHAFMDDEIENIDVTLEYVSLTWVDYITIITSLTFLLIAYAVQAF
jgi:energy-coupling factor transporter transmembrane protein EcfT